MATVIYSTGKYRTVQNLDWLLRHWRDVVSFAVVSLDEHCPPRFGGARLCVFLKDGVRYETEFASAEVLAGFLRRPVFEGLYCRWFDKTDVVGKAHRKGVVTFPDPF